MSERRVHTTGLNSSPVTPHRGYPSLCDDGQPYFPRRRRVGLVETVDGGRSEDEWTRFPWIRLIAVLALIVIMAALATGM